MNHDETLRAVVAGGPASVEAGQHLAQCSRCREEAAALKAIEAALREAAPAPAPAHWQETVVLRLSARHRAGWDPRPWTLLRWRPALASAALAAGLALAWMGFLPFQSRHVALSVALAPPRPSSSPTLTAREASLLDLAHEDSTASLLQWSETSAAELGQPQAGDLGYYLAATELGGWNG
ncbi:MAG: hypothetical protein ACP5VF_02555 [Acidobacteriota bacterium]